jgi:RNA polymerase sigma-70 factor (ECF subfamily)
MDTEFEDLISRVRAGDADSAAVLVHQFETAVRVAVRARLFHPDMRRRFDSMDICQSVMASFFVRVAAGQYDLERPEQLVGLLTKMAQNKLAWHIRHHLQQRRDVRRTQPDSTAVTQLTSSIPEPARQLAAKELLERTWQTMDEELRQIASRRLEGQTWEQVAAGIGGTAGARKKQFERGLDKVALRLGIDEGSELDIQ